MTPTPPSNSSFSHFRFRRSRNPIPYDASNNATPPSQTPVTPLVDEGADPEIEDDGIDDEDEEGADDDDDDEDSEIDENGNGGEDEEEGGIEDGSLCISYFLRYMHLYLSRMNRAPPAGLNLMPAAIRRERLIRGIPQVRVRANREAIARSVVELANGFLRRRAVPMEIDTPFDPSVLGLKEIGNLASWTVSSSKPGCGVEALRDEDTGLFWQWVDRLHQVDQC